MQRKSVATYKLVKSTEIMFKNLQQCTLKSLNLGTLALKNQSRNLSMKTCLSLSLGIEILEL